MKKIATITTHSALNYGAVLQAYALSTYLNSMGNYCEILDYQPGYVNKSYQLVKLPHSPSGVFLTGFQLLHYKERKKRKERFEKFRKQYLKTTYEKATKKEELISLSNSFDLLVCGSDQIWNPKLHQFDEAYFLSYPEIKTKRMSYAASFGQDNLDVQSKEEIRRRITGIERFGCREYSAKRLVEELSEREAEMVLDPVFLISAEEWRKMKTESLDKKKGYVLAYFLSNPGQSIKVVKGHAEKLNKQLYSIGFSPRDMGSHVNCQYDLGPQEFLGAIDSADTIITNSFHATAFAIIFHKQFYTRLSEGADSRNDRMLTLLKQLGLESRTFTDSTAGKIDFSKEIDYEEVEEKLQILIETSRSFLRESIEELLGKDTKIERITTGACTACGACASICPVSCIEIKKNQDGFYMPEIDKSRCIECGACTRVCPVEHRLPGEDWEKGTYYAMWSKEAKARESGSSGGIFGLLADEILKEEGVVFGAAFSEDFKSVIMTCTEDVGLELLKKSKYVESRTGTVYKDVKKFLQQGRKVLYCGTACQIDGLKNYLQKEYKNLITCDFLCHGVSATGLYEKYIHDLERKNGLIKGISFRSKYFGWKAYCVNAIFENGKKYVKTRFQDPYLRIFFENIGLRENCFSCHRLEQSNADITLGDYWGVKKSSDIVDTNEGISLVGVHTKSGQTILETIKGKCEVYQLEKNKYEYAYKRRSYSMANQKMKLKKMYESEDLFEIPVSKKIMIKGKIYQIRAHIQKKILEKNR